MTTLLLIFFSAMIGLCVGSFVNVVILRLPQMLKNTWRKECLDFLDLPAESLPPALGLVRPPSHCPTCKAPIKPWHNIPLLSFILLKGRCRDCQAKISLQYPLVELLSALITAIVVWQFGLSGQMLAALIFSWTLLALAVIDIRTQLLPDNLSLPLLWLGLLLSLTHVFTDPVSAIIGASSAYVVLWLIGSAFKWLRKIEGLGYGDYKLLAVSGAWLGWQVLPFIVLLASLLGLMGALFLMCCGKHKFEQPLPFGPAIALASWIVMLWGGSYLMQI